MQFAKDVLPKEIQAYCEIRKNDLTKNIYYFVIPTENTDVNQEYYVKLEPFSHLQMYFFLVSTIVVLSLILGLSYEILFQTIMMVVS